LPLGYQEHLTISNSECAWILYREDDNGVVPFVLFSGYASGDILEPFQLASSLSLAIA